MGMLDRYKKKGGFYQLLQLIETSPKSKQEQFLGLVANENPVWEEALKKKMLTVDRVYSWDSSYLVEIFSRLPPLTLATALKGNSQEQVDALLSCLPPISKRKIADLMAEANPSPAERLTCLMKIITEVRGFIAQGIIKLEKVDPDMHIPENIEEILAVTAPGVSIMDLPDPKDETSANGSEAPAVAGNNHEVEFLKRKCNQLMAELNAVKHENSVLKDKLAQIKKIA